MLWERGSAFISEVLFEALNEYYNLKCGYKTDSFHPLLEPDMDKFVKEKILRKREGWDYDNVNNGVLRY